MVTALRMVHHEWPGEGLQRASAPRVGLAQRTMLVQRKGGSQKRVTVLRMGVALRTALALYVGSALRTLHVQQMGGPQQRATVLWTGGALRTAPALQMGSALQMMQVPRTGGAQQPVTVLWTGGALRPALALQMGSALQMMQVPRTGGAQQRVTVLWTGGARRTALALQMGRSLRMMQVPRTGGPQQRVTVPRSGGGLLNAQPPRHSVVGVLRRPVSVGGRFAAPVPGVHAAVLRPQCCWRSHASGVFAERCGGEYEGQLVDGGLAPAHRPQAPYRKGKSEHFLHRRDETFVPVADDGRVVPSLPVGAVLIKESAKPSPCVLGFALYERLRDGDDLLIAVHRVGVQQSSLLCTDRKSPVHCDDKPARLQ
ncbi:unnamed protein product [Closterium sp. NIES-64]|nr:unnamed protein product [Closterium sp. NIES-64]